MYFFGSLAGAEKRVIIPAPAKNIGSESGSETLNERHLFFQELCVCTERQG